jgi:hypothetical protein
MRKQVFINRVMLIVSIVAVSLCVYFYYELHNSNLDVKVKTSEEVKSLVGKVSQLYLIPSDEDPTIATVSDPSILKDQSFFNLAEKGDKVLIFNKTGKAVLYRPSINKIIEIAPIKNNSLNSNSTASTPL